MQFGDHNVQTNVEVDAAQLPPPQRVADNAGTSVHNLPSASGVFIGRDLTQLGGLLADGAGAVAVGQAAVYGLGGIGKTELVLQYARTYANRYRLMWWITADSTENVGLGLAELTRRLHPVATLADAQAWALGWLQANQGWLLILDNVEAVEDITDLLGQVTGRGHVVVTTRRDLGRARWARLRLSPLRLGVLDRAASVAMLIELTGLTDAASADHLAADLGDLPLALEQAAAYISQHHGLDLDGYRALLADHFTRVTGDGGHGSTAQRTVGSIWQVTMNAIRDRSTLADRVMRVLGWLAPDGLPDDVLLPLAEDPADLHDALALLASYCMISQNAGTVSVHRLVQAVTRSATPPDGLDDAIRLLDEALPEDPNRNVAGWPRWNALLPHIDTVLNHLPGTHCNAAALHIGDRMATYRQSQGQVATAVTTFEQVLTDSLRVFGGDHPSTLTTRNNLAGAYQAAGRVGEAIGAFEQLLSDRLRVLGGDHPSTLTTRNNLAVVYQAAGRVGEAIGAFEQLLSDFLRVCGDDDPSTLTTYNNLVATYRSAGRVDEAIIAFEKLLIHSGRVLGDDDPGTLTTRNNLALAYRDAGRVGEAIIAFEQLLSDFRRVCGDDHPDTLTTRNNLALAYQDAGRVGEAIAAFEQLLIDRQRVCGDNHPGTLTTRKNLAHAYQDAGRVGEAITAFEQLLTDSRSVLGHNHLDTLDTCYSMALAYRLAGRVGEAVTALEQLLTDLRRVLGEEHATTITVGHSLAVTRAAAAETEP
ncbi:tetratricopeptide repeat protein [Micromonospora taraxaci]|uniref:tetratricopeptide repeat protein n=1 Tax=Micromonospora taraxaci TaxID=1316803 RepID=UPI0033F6A018